MERCPNCLNPWDGDLCETCGFRPGDALHMEGALPMDSVLKNRYRVTNILGVSRQSIAYSAWDSEDDRGVIVLEFFPGLIVERHRESVQAHHNETQFQDGVRLFQRDTGKQPFPLADSFSANETAYRVYAMKDGTAPAEQAEQLLDAPVLFRDEDGKPMMSINCLTIQPIPQERPYEKAAFQKNGKKKHMALLAGLIPVLVLVVAVTLFSRTGPQKPPTTGEVTTEAHPTEEVTAETATEEATAEETTEEIPTTEEATSEEAAAEETTEEAPTTEEVTAEETTEEAPTTEETTAEETTEEATSEEATAEIPTTEEAIPETPIPDLSSVEFVHARQCSWTWIRLHARSGSGDKWRNVSFSPEEAAFSGIISAKIISIRDQQGVELELMDQNFILLRDGEYILQLVCENEDQPLYIRLTEEFLGSGQPLEELVRPAREEKP